MSTPFQNTSIRLSDASGQPAIDMPQRGRKKKDRKTGEVIWPDKLWVSMNPRSGYIVPTRIIGSESCIFEGKIIILRIFSTVDLYYRYIYSALQTIDDEKFRSGARCKFISEYIRKETGASRTPHQISSWLQQRSRVADGYRKCPFLVRRIFAPINLVQSQ